MRRPEFWDRDGALARALAPASGLWALGARLREAATTPFHAPVPVICVGNLTVGGAGKTPVALAIGERLAARGHAVFFLTRGYGGEEDPVPLLVDPAQHRAARVGDESLLLAAVAPTVVCRERAAGAREAVARGAGVIVMDDGLQNPGLAKDLSLVVVDGATGFGNGRVVPAGPLRETVARGLGRAQAAVLVGDDRCGVLRTLPPGLPVLRARLAPENGAEFRGARVVAFAGIARPGKLFETLAGLEAVLVGRFPYPDHFPYPRAEVERLLERARIGGARLVTTAKDWVRLPPDLRDEIRVLHVRAAFADEAALDALLDGALRG